MDYCSFDVATVLSRQQEELDSGDYEDITSKGNETENLHIDSES